MMSKWKTRLEIWNESEKVTSRWIRILCGFLQGDRNSPVGFCISEIPVCVLLQNSRGYRMGEPGNRVVKRTHNIINDHKSQRKWRIHSGNKIIECKTESE